MGTAPRRGPPEQGRLAPGGTRGLCKQGLLLRGLQGGGGPGTEQQSHRSARSPPPCPSFAPHMVTLPALDQSNTAPPAGVAGPASPIPPQAETAPEPPLCWFFSQSLEVTDP